MKKSILAVSFSLTLLIGAVFLISTNKEKLSVVPTKESTDSKLASLSIPFVENQGQAPSDISFYADTFAGKVGVAGDGLVYSFTKSLTASGPLPSGNSGQDPLGKGESQTSFLKESFIGANPVLADGTSKAETKVSYFIGSDKSKWQSGLDSFNSVSLGELWKGVSVELKAYGNNVEKLFTVSPYADPSQIQLSFTGSKGMQITEKGTLQITTSGGDIALTKPVAYQMENGEKKFVDVSYKTTGEKSYAFALGAYDKSRAVVIDPLLGSTFMGGSGSDTGNAIAVDSSGNVYVTGSSASGFQVTSGAYDEVHNGSTDVFVSKLNSTLTTLSASTFIGGSGADIGYAIKVDSLGSVYVAGSATSSTTPFPSTAGAYDETQGGSTDVFVSKLDSTLTTLSASTFIGGSGAEIGYALVLDASSNVYVTGSASTGFQVTSGAYDEVHNGSTDVFVSKLNSTLATLSASTFIGGSGADVGNGIALDSSGNVYVVGTVATGFPVTSGAYDEIYNSGDTDVFVSKLDSTLTTLSASTFIGGSGADLGTGIVADSSDNVYIVGYTGDSTTDFPTISGAYDQTHNGGTGGAFSDVFVSKFNSTLTTLSASTFVGGAESEFGQSIALDSLGSVYITGFVSNATPGYPVTSGAYDETHAAGYDVFISKFNSTLTTLSVSTFVGGSGFERGLAVAIGPSNKIYIAGRAEATDFTMPVDAYDTSHNGSIDLFVAGFDDLNLSGNTAPVSTIGTPAQVSASNTISFSAVVFDTDSNTSTLQVQYSTDLSTWASSTLGSVTGSTTTVSTVTGQISNIGTNTGTTTLTIAWIAGTDLANTYDSSVYLRIKPYDGTAYASGFTTSTAFAVDTRTAATPTGLTVYPEGQTLIRLDWTGNNPTYIVNNVTLGTTSSVSTAYQSIASGLSCATSYTFKVLGQSFIGTNSDYTSTVSATTYPCSGGGTAGGGGGGSSSAPSVQSVPAVTVVTPIVAAPVVSTPTLMQLQSQLAALMQQLQSMQSLRIPAASYSFTSGFGPNSRGEQVRQLQIYLNTHGFPVSSSGLGSLGNETSFFGPATTRALEKFQKSLGLVSTPWVGPATRAHLNK